MPQTVGIVGVGTMGLPMAANLVAAGHTVLGYRRSVMPPEFLGLGGHAVASAGELAERCDVVLTILPTAQALEEVVQGERGLLGGGHAGLVVVEMSTLPVEEKQRARDALSRTGADMLDAPISGMPGMVAARTAAIFGSGDDATFQRTFPLLESIVPAVHYLGGFGAGTRAKYIAHLLVAVHTLAAAEALALARSAGMDLDRLYKVLSTTVAASTALAVRGPMMISGTFTPAPGPVDTLHEGLEQVAEFAHRLGAATPLGDLALQLYGDAQRAGDGELDISVMVRHLGLRAAPATAGGSGA